MLSHSNDILLLDDPVRLLHSNGFKVKVKGGGRIDFNEEDKRIFIFGYRYAKYAICTVHSLLFGPVVHLLVRRDYGCAVVALVLEGQTTQLVKS